MFVLVISYRFLSCDKKGVATPARAKARGGKGTTFFAKEVWEDLSRTSLWLAVYENEPKVPTRPPPNWHKHPG